MFNQFPPVSHPPSPSASPTPLPLDWIPTGNAPFLDPDAVSPRAALATLEHEELNLDIAISLVKGLIVTTESRERARAAQEEMFEATRRSLFDEISELNKKVRRLQAGEQHPPAGYITNNNHLPSLTVPIGNGRSRPARFIQKMADGKVSMIAEHDDGIPLVPHIADVYATPKYDSTSPFEPMPAWFRQLLVGPAATYHIVVDAAGHLRDWGIEADIGRFRSLHEQFVKHSAEINVLQAQINVLQAQIESVKCAMVIVQSRLEGARAHKELGHFEGLAMGRRTCDSEEDHKEGHRQA